MCQLVKLKTGQKGSTHLHGRAVKFMHKYARKKIKRRESPLLTLQTPKGAVHFFKLAKAMIIMVV